MLGDFLSLFQSESRRMWYTISLPTIYGENHHCHTKYSGGIPVALDKKIKRSCQSPARIQGTRAFRLQGLIWTCEAFYRWYVTCQSGDCSSWWQAECPKGSKFIPRASVQILLSDWDPCRKGSHSMLDNVAEDGRKLAVRPCRPCSAFDSTVANHRLHGPPALIALHSRSFLLRM